MAAERAARSGAPLAVMLLPVYGGLYALFYWASVRFALVPPGPDGIALLWLPSGVQASALLLTRRRRWWPVVLATGVSAELLSGWWLFGPLNHISVIAALGNAGEATLFTGGLLLLVRVAAPTLHRTREVVALGVTAVGATAANAGVMSHWVDFRTYWTGDLMGILALVPPVICASHELRRRRAGGHDRRGLPVELLALTGATAATLLAVFGRGASTVADASTVALLWPLLAWSAARFGPSATAAQGFVVMVTADLFTRAGRGPYGAVAATASSRVAALQGLLALLVLSSLAMAAGLAERNRAETALARAGDVDPLTGLPTLAVAHAHLASGAARDGLTGVLTLDLDDFGHVNSRFGREVGDDVLRQVADRLQIPLRSGDLVARVGADEFVVVIAQLTSPQSAQATAERVLATLTAPFTVAEHVITVTTCSGLALREQPEVADRVLARATAALGQARTRGPGHSSSLDARAFGLLDDARRLQAQLHLALGEGQLQVHYQPIVSTRTGSVVAVEALVRWQHPQLGLLTAGQFIPGAEASGYVVAVDDWVVERALRDIAQLRRHDGLEQLTLFVNLSARTLAEPDCGTRLRSALRRHAIAPTAVVLEVTETALVEDSEIARLAAAELAGAGLSLALDDFGQGHASLARLRALPISVVKIDQAFVDGVGRNQVDDAFVRWITRLATDLRMSTVAEGVNDIEQVPLLAEMGVDFVQGFAIAHPLPLASLLEHVTATQASGST